MDEKQMQECIKKMCFSGSAQESACCGPNFSCCGNIATKNDENEHIEKK